MCDERKDEKREDRFGFVNPIWEYDSIKKIMKYM